MFKLTFDSTPLQIDHSVEIKVSQDSEIEKLLSTLNIQLEMIYKLRIKAYLNELKNTYHTPSERLKADKINEFINEIKNGCSGIYLKKVYEHFSEEGLNTYITYAISQAIILDLDQGGEL
jgi:hypothetical protein